MFPLSLFHRNKTPIKLRNEIELEQLKMNDDYDRLKSIKDFFMLVLMIITLLLLIALVIEYIKNSSFKSFVLSLIEQNASGIIFYILTIVGITQIIHRK